MAAGGTILVASNGGLTTLTLNRPDKLNSFNEAMHAELRTALEHCAADTGCRAVLLTGAGRAFCAGQDLSDRAMSANEGPPDLGDRLDRLYNPLIQLVRTLEKPIVCGAVNGVAAGAGANLALACDIVLAARSASFIQAFCRLGLIPDAGGTWLLPRLVGEARARGLVLLGERITASQAEAWGLIWRCVDDDRLLPEAMATAEQLAQGATRGLALIKQALNASAGNSLDDQLRLESRLQQTAGRTDDYQERVRAFQEKRAPCFRGT
jgi:2-(1,2-epoxy-1,2-dihydrophenyl)acetyl-CoA isomerase